MAYKNIEDQHRKQKEHYNLNKEVYKKRACRNNKKYRARNRRFIDRYKTMFGCSKCGYKKYAVALDFHHVDGNDRQIVAYLKNKSCSIETIKKEIRKCIILCANCHRVYHFKE